MGQEFSSVTDLKVLDPQFIPAERVEDMEQWSEEPYHDRTKRLNRRMEEISKQDESPTVAIVPTNYRDSYNEALATISAECQEDDWKSQWWLYRFWDSIEWSIEGLEDIDHRPASKSTVEHFREMIDLRQSRADGAPWAVTQELIILLKALFKDPKFALTEWLMISFSQWLCCTHTPDMPKKLEYLNQGLISERKPIENPQTPFEHAIANLPRKPIESLIEPDEVAECGICHEDVDYGTEVTVLEPFCEHWFHTGCIHYVLRMGGGTALCPACCASSNVVFSHVL